MTAAPPAAPAAPPDPEQRRQLVEASVASQFETIANAADDCDLIVGATALQIAAPSVAETLGIPYVFVAYCPNVLPSRHHAPPPLPAIPGESAPPHDENNDERWARDGRRFNSLFGAALNTHRASLDLPPIQDVRSYVLTLTPWLAADPVLAPWTDPADETVVQTGAWVVRDTRPLGSDLDAFLDAGTPPIYFGFGSMRLGVGGTAATSDLSRLMIEAARALGRRAIVARGWAELSLVDDGVDCLAIDEVNQQALFPRAAAIVHHGGAGTTTAAALSSTPQVIVPQIYDQHYFAARVQELGIGVAHAAGAPTTESLIAALERALQPEVHTRATAIAAAMSRDSARAAAERLVSAYNPRD
jgi:vancomycin aglycone glucosyltransferase